MTKELTKRVITSIILAAIVLNCLFINNYSWLFLLIVISLISCSEFFNLIKKIYKKIFLRLTLLISSFFVLFLFTYCLQNKKRLWRSSNNFYFIDMYFFRYWRLCCWKRCWGKKIN